MSIANLFIQSTNSFAQFWAARDTRERMMLAVGAGFVALALIYLLLIDPALTGRKQLDKNLPALRQQVAQLQALSKEVAALSGNTAGVVAAMSREGIEGALARKGLKPQNVIVTGDQAKVELAAVSFAGTLDWLDEIQRTALLAVVDAKVVTLAQPDMVDVTVVLRQQRTE